MWAQHIFTCTENIFKERRSRRTKEQLEVSPCGTCTMWPHLTWGDQEEDQKYTVLIHICVGCKTYMNNDADGTDPDPHLYEAPTGWQEEEQDESWKHSLQL